MSDQVELLMSKIVVDDVEPGLWDQFVVAAEADPTLWRELAEMRRDQAALCQTLEIAGDIAERIGLPERGATHTVVIKRNVPSWFGHLQTWAGWAVAAVLAVVVIGRFAPRPPSPSIEPIGTQATLAGPATAEEALQAYLDLGRRSGQVVGEMPTKVLLDTRPAEDGLQVLYLRQFVEQKTVPDLFHVDGQTESGEPTLVRWEQPAGGAM